MFNYKKLVLPMLCIGLFVCGFACASEEDKITIQKLEMGVKVCDGHLTSLQKRLDAANPDPVDLILVRHMNEARRAMQRQQDFMQKHGEEEYNSPKSQYEESKRILSGLQEELEDARILVVDAADTDHNERTSRAIERHIVGQMTPCVEAIDAREPWIQSEEN